jgi:transcription initiation factor TFIIIB Brf1 subunit/transcription initiation factor TFIIB
MKCTRCGSTNNEKNHTRGETICMDCGQVLEEGEVVFDVAFENTKVVGTFVGEGGAGSYIRNRRGHAIIDSSHIRLTRAYRVISSTASKLCKHL